MLDVEEHGGRLVCWRGHAKGHQVILLVHDGRLVDEHSSLIWNRDPDNLRRLAKGRRALMKTRPEVIPAGIIFTAIYTWEWGRDSPRWPVKPRATMTRSREAERMTQNALCGKRDWEDAAESPSWGDVSTHKDRWQAFRTVLVIS